MTQQSATLASQISDAAAIMCQAKSVLELVGDYGSLEPDLGSAVYGAATIVQAAISALNAIETEIRHAEVSA